MTSGQVGPFDQTLLFRSRSHEELAAMARRLRHMRIVPGFDYSVTPTTYPWFFEA